MTPAARLDMLRPMTTNGADTWGKTKRGRRSLKSVLPRWFVPAAVVVGVLLLTTGVAVGWFLLGGSSIQTSYTIIIEHHGAMGAMAGGISESTSARQQAPPEAGLLLHIWLETTAPRLRLFTRERTEDETLKVMWFTLCREEKKTLPLRPGSNVMRRFLGKSILPEKELVERTVMQDSQKVYLRITPAGELYVSSAEDRAHKLHDGYVALDPGASRELIDAACVHWDGWMGEVDTLIQMNPPTKAQWRWGPLLGCAIVFVATLITVAAGLAAYLMIRKRRARVRA